MHRHDPQGPAPATQRGNQTHIGPQRVGAAVSHQLRAVAAQRGGQRVVEIRGGHVWRGLAAVRVGGRRQHERARPAVVVPDFNDVGGRQPRDPSTHRLEGGHQGEPGGATSREGLHQGARFLVQCQFVDGACAIQREDHRVAEHRGQLEVRRASRRHRQHQQAQRMLCTHQRHQHTRRRAQQIGQFRQVSRE